MVKITLPDGTVKKFEKETNALEVAKSISEGLARASIAANVNGELTDLTTTINKDSEVSIITTKDEKSLEILRHTTAHVFAGAVLRLFPKAKITIGPPIENGFYYDVDCEEVNEDNLSKIESEMQKIIKEDLEITFSEKTKDEALKFFKNNEYKREIIEAIFSGKLNEEELEEGKANGNKVKFYKQGEFEDMCTGPHLQRTGLIKAFKLEKVTKAYWRGDSNNKQLSRVYGTAFWKKSDLDEHFEMLEEAKKRDHRVLGNQMKLFMFNDYSPGSPFFLPKGFTIWRELQKFIREEYLVREYDEVMTPNMFNKKLWETSGHWQHYQDDMFVLNVDKTDFALKPMNCPSHCLIFKNEFRSYKELPLRIADFGALHRNELSGALSGLTRVRKFCQDDAHIFCTTEQIEDEIDSMLKFIDYVYNEVFKMPYEIELSTRPEDSLGTDEMWQKAEAALEKAIKRNNKEFKVCEGDGAFYGPKIDFRVRDSLNRIHQTATVQLDFNLPERFELKYESEDGLKQPVMIHRAILGSIERFMAIIIEHYAGKFPLWLSPTQVQIINVADRHLDYCKELESKFKSNGFRVETSFDHQTVSNKIRIARDENKPNYMIIIGDEDIEKKTISVRTRKFLNGKNEEFTTTIDKFLKDIIKERDNKEVRD